MYATIHFSRRSIADEPPARATALADRLPGDRAAGRSPEVWLPEPLTLGERA